MTINENDASFSTADASARAHELIDHDRSIDIMISARCDRIRICHLATWLRPTDSLGVVHHEHDGKKINLFE